MYYAVGSVFRLEQLRNSALLIPQEGANIGAAMSGLVDSLYTVQADLAARIVRDFGKAPLSGDFITDWIAKSCPRATAVLDKLARSGGGYDFAALVVMEQQLRQLL